MKKTQTAMYILSVVILLLAFAGISKMSITKKTSTKNEVLALCTGHAKNNVHYHAQLTITINVEPYTIPANIGLADTCIHPVHTHDTTGLIHLDYPRKHPFTLGDFFQTWGVIFSKDQLASIHTYDGYAIDVFVNGQKNSSYSNYILKDRDKIDIKITRLGGQSS